MSATGDMPARLAFSDLSVSELGTLFVLMAGADHGLGPFEKRGEEEPEFMLALVSLTRKGILNIRKKDGSIEMKMSFDTTNT